MPTPLIGKLSLLHQRVDQEAKTFRFRMVIVLPVSHIFHGISILKYYFLGVNPRFYDGLVKFERRQRIVAQKIAGGLIEETKAKRVAKEEELAQFFNNILITDRSPTSPIRGQRWEKTQRHRTASEGKLTL
jgi:hypothetical protein